MRRFLTNKLIATLWLALSVILTGFFSAAPAMDGELTHFVMPNGLKVFVREDHSRKVTAVQMWVMVGSAYDTERGISHVIEHMAFKGTKRRGVGQIDKEVQEIGGQMNAYTSWDETVIHVVVPSPVTSHAIDIITDAAFRAVIDPNELEKEKKVVLEEELYDKDRPQHVASNLLYKTAYIKSQYRFPIIGNKESFKKVTRKAVMDYRKKWYVPENMFLLVVGDVAPVSVRKDVERFTSDVKPTGFFKAPLPQEPPQEQIRTSVARDSAATETRLSVAFHVPAMKGNDVNALDLVADILGARDDSRLTSALKREKGIVTSISASCVTPKDPGLMIISATLPANNLEAATREIMEELAGLAETPPSAEELEQAKIHIESEQVYNRETVQDVAESMGSYQTNIEDAAYEEKYLTLNSAVTPQQISAAVKAYLMPPNVTVSVLLPEGEGKEFRIEQLEKIVSSFDPHPKRAAAGVSPPPRALLKELSNGMKVVLVADNSNPVISFRIACLGGKRFENENSQGIVNFISRMLDKGAGNMTDLDIARKVGSMGGSVSGFSGNDSFGLYASFFSRHWYQGLELLSQLFTEPTFPQDRLERERDLIVNDIKTEPDTPTTYVMNLLNKTLFPRFSYGFNKLGTVATVASFTADDLRQTYKRFAVPSNTVIAVVGRMDPPKVLESMEQLFGIIPPAALEMPKIPAQEPLEKVRENIMHVPRAKAHLAIGFRATTISDPDRFPLDVLNHVLGQEGRLFRQLRDKESLAFDVTSFFRPGMEPGVFGLYMACDAPKAARAYEGLLREVELIKKAKVSDEELKRAVNDLIGNHLISLQSSWDRAEEIGLNTLYGLGYDYDPVYIRKIREVKAEDVLRVARKYLDPERCAIVKILPEGEEKPK
ncbi:MAG: M16 family metallopeptidase [Desulfomonilaceae bacterium]